MRGVGLLALCVGLSLAAPGIEDFLHKHGFSNLTKNFLDEEVRMEVLSSQLPGWRLGHFLASFLHIFFCFPGLMSLHRRLLLLRCAPGCQRVQTPPSPPPPRPPPPPGPWGPRASPPTCPCRTQGGRALCRPPSPGSTVPTVTSSSWQNLWCTTSTPSTSPKFMSINLYMITYCLITFSFVLVSILLQIVENMMLNS